MDFELNLLNLQPFADRLEANAPGVFREIGFAADLAAVTAPGGVVAGPSAYIVQTNAAPYEIREGSGPLRQIFDVTVSVYVAVLFAGQRGAAGVAALQQPCSLVRGALFGFRHPDAEMKTWSGGEGLEDFDAKSGLVIYGLHFLTQVKLTETL